MLGVLRVSRAAKKQLTLFLCVFFASSVECNVFKCDGGSTVLDQSQVNDNFCDCMMDGADEFLTPACAHSSRSRFTCLDSGPLNQTILMSRVWDGVCDCCDGSDELQNQGGGARDAPSCDPFGCEAMIGQARADAVEAHERIKAGLGKRSEAEAEGRKAVKLWETSLRDEDLDEEQGLAERKSVEKLQAQLKVYLQDEERLERRERESLARSAACRSDHGWSRAAALGPCVNDAEEQESAARVRAARAAARARRDAEEEEEEVKKGHDKRGRRSKGSNASERRSRDRGKRQRKGSSDPGTAEDILDLRVMVGVDGAVSFGSGKAGNSRPVCAGDDGACGETPDGSDDDAAGAGDPLASSGNQEGEPRGAAGEAMSLSLRSYVKQRQEGSIAKGVAKTDEKKAEELRETALLGAVLNAGERGVYLGLTWLLRAIGLPLFGPLRPTVAVCWFVGQRVTEAAAYAAVSFGLPKAIVNLLEGYRDHGLPGLNRRLDYRRFPILRSVMVRCQKFFAGPGKFLVVIWDAPVALWEFLFPERFYEHQRPEAAMLREGIELARASLEARDRASPSTGRPRKSEAERMLGLDLGEGRLFAALAEICLELKEGGYTYNLCPFKEAKQGKFSLGRWKGWGLEQGRDGQVSMLFDGGSRCHNNKKRSAEVLMECGPDHALVSATELEIGSYLLTMETPLACTDASLLETQRRLENFDAHPWPSTSEISGRAPDSLKRQQDRVATQAEILREHVLEGSDGDVFNQSATVFSEDDTSDEDEGVFIGEAEIPSPGDSHGSLGDGGAAKAEVPSIDHPNERREGGSDAHNAVGPLGDDPVEQQKGTASIQNEQSIPRDSVLDVESQVEILGSEGFDERYQDDIRDDQVGDASRDGLDVDVLAETPVSSDGEVQDVHVTHETHVEVASGESLEGGDEGGIRNQVGDESSDGLDIDDQTDSPVSGDIDDPEVHVAHVTHEEDAVSHADSRGEGYQVTNLRSELETSSDGDLERQEDANVTAQAEVPDRDPGEQHEQTPEVKSPSVQDVEEQCGGDDRLGSAALGCSKDLDEQGENLVVIQADEDGSEISVEAEAQGDEMREAEALGENNAGEKLQGDVTAGVQVPSNSDLDDERQEGSNSMNDEVQRRTDFDERREEL